MDDFLCHHRHLNFSSVHLSVFLVIVLGFFIDKFPPCFLKLFFWASFFLRNLILNSAKFFHVFLRVFGTAGTVFFFSSGTLHGSSWERGLIQFCFFFKLLCSFNGELFYDPWSLKNLLNHIWSRNEFS